MKFPSLAILGVLLASATAIHAQVSPIRLKVEQVSKSDKENEKGKETRTQKRSLKLTVSRNGQTRTVDLPIVDISAS